VRPSAGVFDPERGPRRPASRSPHPTPAPSPSSRGGARPPSAPHRSGRGPGAVEGRGARA